MNLIRFGIKSSIVGGIVYYTYKEGLWSKSEETAALYKKIKHKKLLHMFKKMYLKKLQKRYLNYQV
uniref:MICOS complex subunit MIC13 n=1 Tax=Apis cerana TaxID=7461 RepID=V9IK36_APICE